MTKAVLLDLTKATPDLAATQAALVDVVKAFAPNFTRIDDVAVEIARKSAARQITELSDDKKRRVARIVARGMSEGWGEQAIADKIAETVGLHSRYADSVDRYRQSLIDGGMSKGVARTQSRQYAQRLRAQRAMTIARTEMERCLAEARKVVWGQEKDGGNLPGAVRVVHTRPDCCDICRRERGKRRSVKHTTGGPPFHPNCHCWEELAQQPAVPIPVAPFMMPIGKEDDVLVIKDRRPASFNPDAKDGDNDGLVQDGTIHERPATALSNAPDTPEQDIDHIGDLIAFAEAHEGVTASEMQGKAAQKIHGGAINNFVVMVEHDDKQFLVKQPGMGKEYRNEEVGGAVADAFGLPYGAVIINEDAVDHGGEYGDGPEDYFDDEEAEGDPMIVFPYIDGDVGYEAIDKLKAKHPGRPWEDNDDFMRIAVMDLILQNRDRHSGNWMLRKDGRIVPIDHGFLNFSESDDLIENEFPHLELSDTEGQEDDRAELLDRLIERVTSAYNSPNKWWLDSEMGLDWLASYEDDLKDMYNEVQSLYELDSYERDIIMFRFDLLLERLGITW